MVALKWLSILSILISSILKERSKTKLFFSPVPKTLSVHVVTFYIKLVEQNQRTVAFVPLLSCSFHLHCTKAHVAAYSAVILSLLLSSPSVEALLMLTMGKCGSMDRPVHIAY